MACANGVFGEDERAFIRIPDGNRPIADKFGKAILAPTFVGFRDQSSIRRTDAWHVSEFVLQLRAVIEATVPAEDRPGFGDMRLSFEEGIFRSMERAVQNADTAFGVRTGVANRAVRGKQRIDPFQIVQGERLAIDVPSSELYAHVFYPMARSSASVKFGVDLWYVWLVVHHASAYFDPGMGFEWRLLDADH